MRSAFESPGSAACGSGSEPGEDASPIFRLRQWFRSLKPLSFVAGEDVDAREWRTVKTVVNWLPYTWHSIVQHARSRNKTLQDGMVGSEHKVSERSSPGPYPHHPSILENVGSFRINRYGYRNRDRSHDSWSIFGGWQSEQNARARAGTSDIFGS